MAVQERLLSTPESHAHVLQLYGSDRRALTTTASRYLLEGLQAGDHLLVIATANHRREFVKQLRQMGGEPDTAQTTGQLTWFDAGELLSRFMVDGQPDPLRFEVTVGAAVRQIRAASAGGGLRAYGDMVGLLWDSGQCAAAVRLEGLWNRLLGAVGFRLFCSCPIDVFDHSFRGEFAEELLCAHTRLMPCGSGDLESALRLAMKEASGRRPVMLWPEANGDGKRRHAALPSPESWILKLRKTAPEEADEVLSRAREHYQAEKRFRALIENSLDAICLADQQGNVVYASASNERLFGYSPDELSGRNVMEFVHPDDIDRVRQNTREVLAGRGPVRFEVRVQRKDGSWRWVESTSSNLLHEPDVRAIVLNYRDISERKSAEERMKRDAERLARYNAELEAFAYAAAHDLKEPLRTIRAFTELLVQRTNAENESARMAGFIVEGVNRMSRLLDDLLSFTRISFDEAPGTVALQDILEQAVRNLEQAIRESGTTVTADELPRVKGSATHLVQVMQNLLSNSIKYRGEAPAQIHVSAARSGGEWTIRVKDNGIGIPPEYHERIFGLFKRLHAREIPGTGIGLAICRKIIAGTGGRIWVESERGKGATFCFTAPAC